MSGHRSVGTGLLDRSGLATVSRPAAYTLVLSTLLIVAIGLRLGYLVPPERGVFFAADADEGIYATSARLALDGYLPYRDYFCSAPPLALYLFMTVLAATSPPWGSEAGFIALRYASVAYGMVTLLAVYTIGARLGGRRVGLLAAGLLAIDGWAVQQDRRAMLEAPMNMFSALSMLTLIIATHSKKRRWYILAGILAGMAVLTKTQGVVVLLAMLVTLVLQRRWREAGTVLCLSVATYLALSLPYLLATPGDFMRQLFFFQFLRPPNGDPSLMLRVNAIRNYAQSWLTVRLGLLGGIVLLARWLWGAAATSPRPRNLQPREHLDGGAGTPLYQVNAWLGVWLWAILVAASFMVSKTFYLYYYAQLAVPLALLGSSLLLPWTWGQTSGQQRSRRWLEGARVIIIAVLLILAVWRLPIQLQATVQATRWVKDAYANIGRYLKSNSPASMTVLVFEPNYTFLASRPLARLPGGMFFVDSHAHMLYMNLGIRDMTWAELFRQLARRELVDEQTLLWQQPAQQAVAAALGAANGVVIDRRARYLCTPETIRVLEAASEEAFGSSDTTLRMNKVLP